MMPFFLPASGALTCVLAVSFVPSLCCAEEKLAFSLETRRFDVQSDAGRELCADYGEYLESLWTHFEKIYKWKMQTGRFRHKVRIFKNKADYDDLCTKVGFEGQNEDFTKAIEAEPENYRYYYFRSLVLLPDGKLDECIKDCEKAIFLFPESASAYLELGMAYYYKKEYAKAKGFLNESTRLCPDLEKDAKQWLDRIAKEE